MDKRTFIKLATLGTAFAVSQFIPGGRAIAALAPNPDTTEFLKACEAGNTPLIKSMLASTPNLLQARDDVGRSGFALALLAGQKETGTLLKEAGFETDAHEAALDLDWDRFKELMESDIESMPNRVNADHPLGGTAMWAAAAGGAGTSIWRIYAQCGDPNASPRGSAGSSPLQAALQFADLETAELTASSLLGNACDPNPARNSAQPPLHLAAQRGSYDLVELLIRWGADVKQKDQQGKTARQLAEEAGHEKVYHLLRKHKKIARTCRNSRLAYDRAGNPYQAPDLREIPQYRRGKLVGMSHGNLEGVKAAIDEDRRMAHSIATTSEIAVEAGAHMGNRKMVELLLSLGAPYSLPTAVMMGDYATVKRLLKEDPNRIHERGAHDFALLWYPIIGKCEPDMMQLLLDQGGKVEEQHFLGTTALHWASMAGNLEMMEMLIENGADVNRKGRKFGGKYTSPLQMAREEKAKAFLRSRGAV